MWKTIFKYLFENYILIFLVLGILLLLLGTAQSIALKSFVIMVPDIASRIVLAVIGSVLVLFSVIHTWFKGSYKARNTAQVISFNPGIQITNPVQNQKVHGKFIVEGTYQEYPQKRDIRLLVTSTDEDKIWPQAKIVFNQKNKTWTGKIYLWDEPPDQAYLIVVELRETGGILCDYYYKTGSKTNTWVPLNELTSDVIEYARVCVKNES